jgi:hypothetical protein
MITIISGTNRLHSNSIFIAEYYQSLLRERRGKPDTQSLQAPGDFVFTSLENAGKRSYIQQTERNDQQFRKVCIYSTRIITGHSRLY